MLCVSLTIKPAAAFKHTALEKSLSSPLNISTILFALKFAWIVNSEDGLDEISPYAKTNVIQLKDNKISEIVIDPKKLNVNSDKFENLVGNDAKFNADKMINIFKGEDNDFSKAVCLNGAAGLIVNETHKNFAKAYNDTREHILSNKVIKHLEKIQNA